MLKWLAGVVGAIISGLVVYYFTEGIPQRVSTSTPEINQPASPPTSTPEINQPAPAPTPKTLAKVDLELEPEINIPILTIGTSESQLVSTLGQPNLEKKSWQPNSRELVYYDVVPDQVNLSYYLDNIGKIRQINIAFNQSVSLGTMQQTLTKMFGGEVSSIKDKLYVVYNRQTNLRGFAVNDLKGFVKRDAKDRVFISVWDREFP